MGHIIALIVQSITDAMCVGSGPFMLSFCWYVQLVRSILHTFCLHCRSCDEFDSFEQVLFHHFPNLHKFILVHKSHFGYIPDLPGKHLNAGMQFCYAFLESTGCIIPVDLKLATQGCRCQIASCIFSYLFTTSTESPSSSSDSDELAALSVSAMTAAALVLIVMGPPFVCLTLVVLVLHLYGVTTGSSSSSESVGVHLCPVPPLVFFTPLVGDTLRLFKVEVVGAMVSNILAFVGYTT
jgi:hypothetical protein